MSATRQLAAIMFTDIVGYTALMGEDEHKAFEVLALNRHLQKPVIDKYNGRLVKELGDGNLVSFNLVTDAVYAAKEILEKCNEQGGYSLRIGIHQGEIVTENNDVFGDVVNVASRIQSAAAVGKIWISEAVNNELHNKPGIQTRFVKTETLKNVRQPLRLFEVITDSTDTGTSRDNIHTGSFESIAVLPFLNIGNDPENEYFCEGLAEELLNDLGKIDDLKVAARTSAFSFKGKNVEVSDIARILNVQTILEGSVRRSGQRIRITVKLVNANDGYQLWGERYDREMKDIFEVQDDIALAVVQTLRIKLGKKEKDAVLKRYTNDSEAYRNYLRGNYHLYRYTSDDVLKARNYFNEAIAIDPEYALAYTGIAFTYLLSDISDAASARTGEIILKKALDLDPDLAETHLAAGALYFWNQLEIEKGGKAYRKAFELNPNSALVRHYYSWYMLAMGKVDEAKEHLEHALILDPLSIVINADQGLPYYFAREYEKAKEYFSKALAFFPGFAYGRSKLAEALEGMGDYEAAINEFQQAYDLSLKNSTVKIQLARAKALGGKTGEAKGIIEEIINGKAPYSFYYAALTQIALNNTDAAIGLLEKAVAKKDKWFGWAKVDPRLDPVRKDERFQKLLRQTGFEP